MGIEEDNVKFFDSAVNWYDSRPDHKQIHDQVTSSLRNELAWIGANWKEIGANWNSTALGAPDVRTVRLLDYACGTGIVSRALGPFVTQIQGVDLSPGMVNAYNARAFDAGLPLAKISAVVGNLLKDPVPSELSTSDYYDFDIAAIGLALHHFADPEEAVKRLAKRLKSGGTLLVIDVLGGSEHEHKAWGHHGGEEDVKHGITRHGFTGREMQGMFSQARLTDFKFIVPGEEVTFEMKGRKRSMTFFFARGTRV